MKKILSLTILLLVLPSLAFAVPDRKNFQTDTNGTLKTSLQSYYKLEDANDFWGATNLTNVSSTPFNAGKVNNAADFGASNTAKQLKTTNTMGINGDNCTFAMWVNVTTQPGTNATNRILYQENTSNAVDFDLTYNDVSGTKNVSLDRQRPGVGGSTAVTITGTLTTGTWYFIYAAYDGTNVRLSINNGAVSTQAASGNGSVSNHGNGMGVAGIQDGAGISWSGLIDELGVWNKSLSAQEVTDLYNSGSGQTMINVPFTSQVLLKGGTLIKGGVLIK